MTQRTRIWSCIGRIADRPMSSFAGDTSPVPEMLLGALEQVLAEAQNRPPLGASDGTVDEKLWTLARDFLDSYRKALSIINKM